MKLYLNKEIAPDSAKMQYWLSGDDATSYSDIAGFLQFMQECAPNDNRIDIELHSCGGDCTEGWAIYDALRASGKEIHACVVGRCASMASVILLAAPAENRTMYEHAEMLIHEPYYPRVNGEMTIEKLEQVRASLEQARERMVALYAERTGANETALREQMAAGDWFGSERAIELGFISSVVPAISAAAKGDEISTTTNTNTPEMKINNNSALAKAFISLGRAMGVIDDTDNAPVSLVVTDVNGTEIEINREEGEPQVGDETTAADGEYTLEDGRVIVVEGGVITEIRNPEQTEEPEETEETPENKCDDEDKDKKIADLEQQVDELKQQLQDAANARITDEQAAICAAVAEVGGIDKIKAMAVGKFNAPVRSSKTPQASAAQEHLNQKIEELKAAQATARKRK